MREPVNLLTVKMAMDLLASRRAVLGSGGVFAALHDIYSRAVPRNQGTELTVVIREAAPCGSLQNRCYSGVSGMDPPQEVAHETAKDKGLSVFAYSKPIRCLCRAGLNLGEVDLHNSFYVVLARHFPDAPAVLLGYAHNREKVQECFTEAYKSVGVDFPASDCKSLFLVMAFGGNPWSWLEKRHPQPPKLVADFIQAVLHSLRLLQARIAVMYPAELALVANQRNPKASLMMRWYMDKERQLLKAMAEAAGRNLVSLEHDGLCVRNPETMLPIIQAAVPLKVTLKPYPDDPLELLRAKLPGLNWEARLLKSGCGTCGRPCLNPIHPA